MDREDVEKLAISPSFIEKVLPPSITLGDGYLFGLIADEKTCVGFLLAGIGEGEKVGEENFLAVNEKTRDREIIRFFDKLYHRNDIGIIIIESHITKRLRPSGRFFTNTIPIVLEIPSVLHSFKIEEDIFLEKAIRLAEPGKQNNDD